MLIENSTYNVHEVVVNLNANRIESKIRVYGVRPMFYIGGVPLPTVRFKFYADNIYTQILRRSLKMLKISLQIHIGKHKI